MEHKTPVRDRCIKCECLFRDITKIEGCQSFPVVYALHQQFEQWASNLDVYTGNSNLSLDAKLAYSESLQTLVLELLQTIERNLNRGTQSLSLPDFTVLPIPVLPRASVCSMLPKPSPC